VKAEIIPIGTEILLGNIVDTNSSFLAHQLPLLGIDLYFISTVGDNQERLVDALKKAWTRADIIITTGGLGPTQDDITRQAIAELVGEELRVNPEIWKELQALFSQHHLKIPQSNMRQATVIPSAKTIPNPIGTAPGWWVEKHGHIVIAVPGPPDEMQLMWEEGVLPRLRQKATSAVILSKTIKTFGLAEAKIDELLAPLLQLSNPSLATYVNSDGIYLRITAKAQAEPEAQQMIAQREADVRGILAPNIWGVDDDTLESIVGVLLRAKNLSLATMESCTDGLLSNTIASQSESSTYFKGGLVAYCDEAKVTFGADPHLAEHYVKESAQVAEAMAQVARKDLEADIGIGIACNMNQSENLGDVFVALDSDQFKQTITHTSFGNRLRIKRRAVYAALFELRKMLLEEA